MKKSRNKRPVKRRVPRHVQVAAAQREDEYARRLLAIGRAVEALMELAGRDNVRRASAKLAAASSLAALAGHVANGKLVEAQVVTEAGPNAGTCAVEFSESTSSGEVLTESVVAGLADISPEQSAPFLGKRVGEIFDVGERKVQVRRVWDIYDPVPQAVTP